MKKILLLSLYIFKPIFLLGMEKQVDHSERIEIIRGWKTHDTSGSESYFLPDSVFFSAHQSKFIDKEKVAKDYSFFIERETLGREKISLPNDLKVICLDTQLEARTVREENYLKNPLMRLIFGPLKKSVTETGPGWLCYESVESTRNVHTFKTIKIGCRQDMSGQQVEVTYTRPITYYRRAMLGALGLVAAGAGAYKLIQMLRGK